MLTEEQQYVYNELIKQKRPVTRVGGLAGTGKTTVIFELKKLKQFQYYGVAALAGKAANVLQRKGIFDAGTIHSHIYETKRDRLTNKLIFTLKPFVAVDGFIIDESSMIGKKLYNDLLSFNLPVIFVGDHGQLPASQRHRYQPNEELRFQARDDPSQRRGNRMLSAHHIRNGGDKVLFHGKHVRTIDRNSFEQISEYDHT